MIAAFAVYWAITAAAAAIIRAQTGVLLDPLVYNPVMLWGPGAMILLSALSGVAPAWKAYRTDVATNLSPLS
jgi:putative ABC transport system permease protein